MEFKLKRRPWQEIVGEPLAREINGLIEAAREEGKTSEREAIAEDLQLEGWVTAARLVRNRQDAGPTSSQ